MITAVARGQGKGSPAQFRPQSITSAGNPFFSRAWSGVIMTKEGNPWQQTPVWCFHAH
eukprot:CAMPEP_0174316772 /NCGR_PEP_ID=MMETSP0810-20121108/7175_1 /TAXON_ID=73025 ORGANISM="Eutreptiella gymnastica-like, Strain CCMP1594" /NCGR_SAMPLE_ID=MMETSP0810 /ASSEMBLY_ACC=CAM_ASM_000659 /LENGTH=57 /DNA_ID=CAMNT_0015426601 /DNA_START=213 /DNA_END=386 /DNA_ORIENTATION=+